MAVNDKNIKIMKIKICKWVSAITFGLVCFNWCACCCGSDNCCQL